MRLTEEIHYHDKSVDRGVPLPHQPGAPVLVLACNRLRHLLDGRREITLAKMMVSNAIPSNRYRPQMLHVSAELRNMINYAYFDLTLICILFDTESKVIHNSCYLLMSRASVTREKFYVHVYVAE